MASADKAITRYLRERSITPRRRGKNKFTEEARDLVEQYLARYAEVKQDSVRDVGVHKDCGGAVKYIVQGSIGYLYCTKCKKSSRYGYSVVVDNGALGAS